MENYADDNWIYIGIFLDEKSKKKLKRLYNLPPLWNEYNDHMTVVYNDNTMLAQDIKLANINNIGKKFKLKIVGPGISDKAFALKVKIPEGVICANKITHITLGVNPKDGASAVDSNYITNWSKLYKDIYVTGTMKVYKSNGLLMCNKIEEANIY